MTNKELAERLRQYANEDVADYDKVMRNDLLAAAAALEASAPPYPGLHNDAKLGQECESLVALKTHFTGEPPYVGNDGVLLALRESLDELNKLKQASAPEGYVLVPREPTEAMMLAGMEVVPMVKQYADIGSKSVYKGSISSAIGHLECGEVYRAMLSAAPKHG